MPVTVAEDATLTEIYSDSRFFTGPTWEFREGKLYFIARSQTNQQILRFEEPGKVTSWLERQDGMSGMFLSNDGHLLVTHAQGHRIASYGISPGGPTEIRTLLLDPTLHQPNDLCQTPRGDIYFTDPDFQGRKTSAVYRLASSSQPQKVITEMAVPNGIMASQRGRMLYVADSYEKLWRSYPIRRDGSLGSGQVFFKPPDREGSEPDGMTMDVDDNLYLTGLGGVWVVNDKGKLLGFIPVPEVCSGVAFGGRDGKTLYITCSTKVYSLAMRVSGAFFGRRIWQIFQSAE